VAVRPAPRIPRMRRSLNDVHDQMESLDLRVPMASAADEVGPMRVGAGGPDPQWSEPSDPSVAGNGR
jgi:hypothetical protein